MKIEGRSGQERDKIGERGEKNERGGTGDETDQIMVCATYHNE